MLPVIEIVHNYLDTKQIDMVFLVSTSIFCMVICEMLWDFEDKGGQKHASGMASFEDVSNDSEEQSKNWRLECNLIFIEKQLPLFLDIDYLRAGLSFRQSAQVLWDPEERFGLTYIYLCTDKPISKYVRVCCTCHLLKLSEFLEKA